jgi:hypothetical protein
MFNSSIRLYIVEQKFTLNNLTVNLQILFLLAAVLDYLLDYRLGRETYKIRAVRGFN